MRAKGSKVIMILAAFFAVAAHALTINDPGVVGVADGISGDNASVYLPIAQQLLDLPASADVTIGGRDYQTSSTDYTGSLTLVGTVNGSTSVAAGYDYALAKYDGENAGFVLFYLGGAVTTLPGTSYSIWGSNPGQYDLSNYRLFNSSSVPEGGGTVLLLGAVVAVLGVARRKLT